MQTRAGLTATILFFWAACALADLYVELEMTREIGPSGQEQKETSVVNIRIKKDRVIQEQAGLAMVALFEQKLFRQIYSGTQSYSESAFEDIQKKWEERGAYKKREREKLEKKLARSDLTEKDKEKIQQRLAKLASRYRVVVFGQEKVGDHDCTRYVIEEYGQKYGDIWASDELDPRAEYTRFSQLMRPPPDPESAEELKKIKGIWLKWEWEERRPNWTEKERCTLIKLSKAPIEDKVFAIPEGYKRIDYATLGRRRVH